MKCTPSPTPTPHNHAQKEKKCELMHDLIDKMSFISLERPFEIPYAHKRGSVKKNTTLI